jgi:EDD domain protein, DegV family
MLKNYALSCCSTADMTEQHFREREINYICFHYSLNGKQYEDDLGKSMPFDEFYEALSKGAETNTSQVNVDEFIGYFTPFLERGLDILHVCLSSGLSGVYNSANIAKNDLSEKYPDRKIYIVDSLGASSGYGLFMDKLADLRDSGNSIGELYAWANDHKLELNHWFFSTDLTYYVKGGRISKASGWAGTLLNICPLLNMNSHGQLIPRSKVRGKKRVIQEIVKRMEEFARDGLDYNGKCYISNAGCYEDAVTIAALIEARFPKINGRVEIYSVGTTIGSHTGPGTAALFFWGAKKRELSLQTLYLYWDTAAFLSQHRITGLNAF